MRSLLIEDSCSSPFWGRRPLLKPDDNYELSLGKCTYGTYRHIFAYNSILRSSESRPPTNSFMAPRLRARDLDT